MLRERHDAAASPWGVPAWRYDVLAGAERVGTVSLRVGHWYRITHLAGHVGFAIDPPFRGRGLAPAAVRALLPSAVAAGLGTVWLTTTPDNAAAQRVMRKLGAVFADAVGIPADYPGAGDTPGTKWRYRLHALATGDIPRE